MPVQQGSSRPSLHWTQALAPYNKSFPTWHHNVCRSEWDHCRPSAKFRILFRGRVTQHAEVPLRWKFRSWPRLEIESWRQGPFSSELFSQCHSSSCAFRPPSMRPKVSNLFPGSVEQPPGRITSRFHSLGTFNQREPPEQGPYLRWSLGATALYCSGRRIPPRMEDLCRRKCIEPEPQKGKDCGHTSWRGSGSLEAFLRCRQATWIDQEFKSCSRRAPWVRLDPQLASDIFFVI